VRVQVRSVIPAMSATVFVDDVHAYGPSPLDIDQVFLARKGQLVHVFVVGSPVSQCTVQFDNGKPLLVKHKGVRSKEAR